MSKLDTLSHSFESTVVAEYTPKPRKNMDYQSEAQMEEEFIKQLVSQGYERLNIDDEKGLVDNLRLQLEKLNDLKFTDNEWQHFYKNIIANGNDGIVEKTIKIQEDHVQHIKLDSDGSTKNIKLIHKEDIHKNSLQVINQYKEDGGHHKTRYDVTILVNGLPLVHIELKKRGVDIREAFNQIGRYQRDSFWASAALFEYVELFIISNGTLTKYYSNTTRDLHIKDLDTKDESKKKKTSNTFEFTSYWADERNKRIADIVDFTKTFFAKHTLLNIIINYSVFTSEKMLLVMRPYQIAGTEKILNRIKILSNSKDASKSSKGGYIWHTTGSGKTLTSFKASQLASKLGHIDKVLFVVDRKDLDYQTMKEYDKFEKGAADSNTSTNILKTQLENSGSKIIITTIQKLSRFINKYKTHEVLKKRIVMIFDECHRSQFGDMHGDITRAFKNYYMFGFTGTPIFAINSGNGLTTEQIFGAKLHTYTIVDAIKDNNVLPFKIDYTRSIKTADHIQEKHVKAIDTERALLDPRRIANVVEYILEHFEDKTYRSKKYNFRIVENVGEMAQSKKNIVEEKRGSKLINGFNSIFAVSSIEAAKLYYNEFQKQMEALPNKKLNVATIFSFAPNEQDPNEIMHDENFDTSSLDQTSRDFLDSAIADYNKLFATNYSTSDDQFQNYYKDISMRMKNKDIDLLIVVNMFLTGFDATTLNTLWVDKNLRLHGLIQAFSRTNRILNSVKAYGNIVCFRNLEENTNEALALFGDREAHSIVILKKYSDYINGYDDENGKHVAGYDELLARLSNDFPIGTEIVGEQAEKDFIMLFGQLLKLKNILKCFDEFKDNSSITSGDFDDYQSVYIDIYQKYSNKNNNSKESINNDIVFEIELIKQIDINIDYILILVVKYHESNCEDKTIIAKIKKSVNASIELRSKKSLIDGFIDQMTPETNVETDWKEFVVKQKEKDFNSLIKEEKLQADELKKFIANSFRDGHIQITGVEIDLILPKMSRFGSQKNDRAEIKERVIEKLKGFFDKYYGLV